MARIIPSFYQKKKKAEAPRDKITPEITSLSSSSWPILEFKYFMKEKSYLIYGYKLVIPVS